MTKKREVRIGDTVSVQGLVVDQESDDTLVVYFARGNSWGRPRVLRTFDRDDCQRVVKEEADA